MKVCGFTFVRNALKYDYPVVESINSILPLVDHFIVSVGNSEDKTRKLIESIKSKKIEILDTVWDDSLREGGAVLAVETNKAFDAISKEYDWAVYIQADEVMHEKYVNIVRDAMSKNLLDNRVDGLLLGYSHFYGSYDYLGNSRQWYRNEIRVIRNDKSIRSFKDAQGFRKNDGKLKVKKVDAKIYHYGWVKHPKYQQAKQENFHKYWHTDKWMKKNVADRNEFDYSIINSLNLFTGTHPKAMEKRVKKINWTFPFDPTQKKFSIKERLSRYIEIKTGYRIGEYKNYTVIR